jgi:hypothetical protein
MAFGPVIRHPAVTDQRYVIPSTGDSNQRC